MTIPFRHCLRMTRAVPCRRFPAAFTLVELLAVIILIGILAMLLMTAVQSARRTAARADGAAVMRNIGQAMALYINDNQGRVPGPLYWRQSAYYGAANGNLIPKLAPYMGGPAVRTNLPFPPAYAKVWAKALEADPSITIYEINAEKISGYDQWMWGDANVDNQGKKPGSIPLPLSVISLTPAKKWSIQDTPFKDLFASKPLPDAFKNGGNETIWGLFQYRLYLDGHVEGRVLH